MREAAAFRIEKFVVAVADPQLPTTDGSAGGVGAKLRSRGHGYDIHLCILERQHGSFGDPGKRLLLHIRQRELEKSKLFKYSRRWNGYCQQYRTMEYLGWRRLLDRYIFWSLYDEWPAVLQ